MHLESRAEAVKTYVTNIVTEYFDTLQKGEWLNMVKRQATKLKEEAEKKAKEEVEKKAQEEAEKKRQEEEEAKAAAAASRRSWGFRFVIEMSIRNDSHYNVLINSSCLALDPQ